MPLSPKYYGPLDWYDPSYRSMPTMKAPSRLSRDREAVKNFFFSLLEQPVIRSAGVVGDITDEGFRGNTRNDPNWKVAMMPGLPKTTGAIANLGKLKTPSARLAAKAAKTAKTATSEMAKPGILDEYIKAIRSNVSKPKVDISPIPGAAKTLPPELGIVPKSAQTRQLADMPYMPNRVAVTEGPTKTVLGALTPERYKRPIAKPESLDYIDPNLQISRKKPIDVPVQPKLSLPELSRKPLIPEPKKSGILSGIKNLTTRIENRLRSDSPAGAAIADKYRGYRIDKGVISGNWESKYNDIIKNVPKNQWPEIQQSLETGQPLVNPQAESVRRQLVALDSELIGQAKVHDLKLRNAEGTQLVPFTPHENYWPHIYPEGFWDDTANITNALIKKYNLPPELAQQTASRANINGGKLILEPERLGASFAKRFGPQLKTFQHQRVLDLPGYRVDPDAYRIHIRDMADRIAAKKQFGDLDIAGRPGKDEFATLIAQTKNPNEMKKLLTRVFNRETEVPTAGSRKLSNAAMTIGTGKNLSMFMVNNLQQLAALAGQNTPRALMKGVASIPQRTARLKTGLESGALSAVHSDAISGMEGVQNKLSHYLNQAYGMSRGENFNRSIAAVTGQQTAKDLFTRLLKNPADIKLRQRLERLTHTSADELLTQGELTKTQLDKAGGVMAEATQGRAQSFDLPYHWSGGSGAPYKNALLQYKKYPFVQGKLFIDSLAQKPLQTAIGGTAAYLAGGEAVGAVKDAKRAAVDKLATGKKFSKAWKEQRAKRGSGLGRIGKALTEGWMLGLPSDIIESTATRAGGFKEAVTPVPVSMMSDAFDAARRTVTNKTKKKRTEAGLKYMNEWMPYVGRDLNAALYSGKAKSNFPSLPPLRIPSR